MGGLQGRFLIGSFHGVRQVARADGSPVAGLFEIAVRVDAGENDWDADVEVASYFETSRAGVSAMKTTVDKLQPEIGSRVVVRVRSKAKTGRDGTGAFLNDTALAIYSADAVGM